MSDESTEFWSVKLCFYREPNSSWESGIDSSWPVGTSVTKIIEDVARLRNVDLAQCWSVTATKMKI